MSWEDKAGTPNHAGIHSSINSNDVYSQGEQLVGTFAPFSPQQVLSFNTKIITANLKVLRTDQKNYHGLKKGFFSKNNRALCVQFSKLSLWKLMPVLQTFHITNIWVTADTRGGWVNLQLLTSGVLKCESLAKKISACSFISFSDYSWADFGVGSKHRIINLLPFLAQRISCIAIPVEKRWDECLMNREIHELLVCREL